MPLLWETPFDGAPPTRGALSYADGAPPLAQVALWPHRSLPPQGAAAFILATFTLICLPVFPLLGSPVLWGLMPFLMGAVLLLLLFLRRSYRDGTLTERLCIWSDRVELTRHDPRRPVRQWDANPFWVSVTLYAKGGPVDNYLTLKGSGREVEIGAFLSPEERVVLHEQLTTLMTDLRRA